MSVAVTDFWASDAKLRPVLVPNMLVVDLLFSSDDVSSVAGVEVALNVTDVRGDDAFMPFSFEILNVKLDASFFCSSFDSIVGPAGIAALNPPNIFDIGEDVAVLSNAFESNNGSDATENEFYKSISIFIDSTTVDDFVHTG